MIITRGFGTCDTILIEDILISVEEDGIVDVSVEVE